ncbi:hypothetical protein ACFYTG_35030, partial [Streptomyces mirabilis]|uniref:hypothetical protein n=1 Tax=Streptomyces mirabilis TaxID=68239 RepID=UPI00368D5EC9
MLSGGLSNTKTRRAKLKINPRRTYGADHLGFAEKQAIVLCSWGHDGAVSMVEGLEASLAAKFGALFP